MERKYLLQKVLALFMILLGFSSGATKLPPNFGIWGNAKLPYLNINLVDHTSPVAGSIELSCCYFHHLIKLNYSYISGNTLDLFQDSPIERIHGVTISYGYLKLFPLVKNQRIISDITGGIGWSQSILKGVLIPSGQDSYVPNLEKDYQVLLTSGPIGKIELHVAYSPSNKFAIGYVLEFIATKEKGGFVMGVCWSVGLIP